MNEFKEFPKIQRLERLTMQITQKLHGTNAQIYIYQDENGNPQLLTGSRQRWIIPEDDNYGFAKFVYDNKQEFIDKLGFGRHFGEWAGKGINSGEGLPEKRLFLFSQYWRDKELPIKTFTVPLLYSGELNIHIIDTIFQDLKENGSKLVQGYMKPEGIVVDIDGQRYKKVFEDEETQWKRSNAPKKEFNLGVDVSHLLQPIRLEKLLSRDEKYRREYPYSLSSICKDYTKDLLDEQQITGTEDEVKLILKSLGGHLYSFVKANI